MASGLRSDRDMSERRVASGSPVARSRVVAHLIFAVTLFAVAAVLLSGCGS